jgi:hypothetical protein
MIQPTNQPEKDLTTPHGGGALKNLVVGIVAAAILLGVALFFASQLGIINLRGKADVTGYQASLDRERAQTKELLEAEWEKVEQLEISDLDLASLRNSPYIAGRIEVISHYLDISASGGSPEIDRLRDSLDRIRATLREIENARSNAEDKWEDVRRAEQPQKEHEVLFFRVGRRFDTRYSDNYGLYEATQGFTKVVLIAPEEKVGNPTTRAMNGVKLPVLAQGEKPYETQAGNTEYALTYEYEEADEFTEADLQRLRNEAEAADRKLDFVRNDWSAALRRHKP